MKRALLLSVAALGALGVCAEALAAVTTASASLTLQDPVGVNVVAPLILPTISTTAITTSTVVTTPTVNSPIGAGSGATAATSTGGGATPTSNATLTIYGQGGDAVSMAVPETFKVVRSGGTETLTVKTNTNSEYNVAQNGVVLGSGLGGDTMSVNVGGSLTLASAGPLVPGPYEGMLVVVVQYN
jgi:hypothetical protein